MGSSSASHRRSRARRSLSFETRLWWKTQEPIDFFGALDVTSLDLFRQNFTVGLCWGWLRYTA
jgi:hypothetical protein